MSDVQRKADKEALHDWLSKEFAKVCTDWSQLPAMVAFLPMKLWESIMARIDVERWLEVRSVVWSRRGKCLPFN